jgi:hypothetical protein
MALEIRGMQRRPKKNIPSKEAENNRMHFLRIKVSAEKGKTISHPAKGFVLFLYWNPWADLETLGALSQLRVSILKTDKPDTKTRAVGWEREREREGKTKPEGERGGGTARAIMRNPNQVVLEEEQGARELWSGEMV